MTQDALAKEVGCSRSALAGWETALHSVPVRYLWKLARCLRVTVDALYEDEDLAAADSAHITAKGHANGVPPRP